MRKLAPPLLRETVFRRYWGATTISMCGDQVSSIAMPLSALLGSVPVCYALHVLTLAQLCAVAFAAGSLSILFDVADATLFVSVVAPGAYVDGQSLIYGSRALSFIAGPSAGGLLGTALGLRPTLWIAVAGAVLGAALLLPSPLSRFRLSSAG